MNDAAMGLRIKRLHADARLPTRAHPGDAGLDLYADEPVRLEPGARGLIATGIALELPDGHAGLVLPRSGNALRHGVALVNAPGLIDCGYRGEVKVLLLNTDAGTAFIAARGERIAQLVVIAVACPPLLEVDELSEHVRGDGGFGSSGS